MPYNYQWSNGVLTSINENLVPGQYLITVTDAYGCSNVLSKMMTAQGAMSHLLKAQLIGASCGGILFAILGAAFWVECHDLTIEDRLAGGKPAQSFDNGRVLCYQRIPGARN